LVDIDEEGLRETWNNLEPQLKPHVELEFRDLSGEMVYAIEEITLRNKHLGADAVMDALEKKWAAILAKHSFDEPEADVLLSYGLAGHLLDLGLIGNNVLVDPKSNTVHPRLLALLGQIDRDYFVRSAEVARRGGVVAFAQEIKLKTCLPGKTQKLTHQDLPLSYTVEGRPNVGIDRELFSHLHVIHQDRWVWHHAAPYAEGKMNLIPAAKSFTVNEQQKMGEWRDVDALVLVREE